MKFIKTLIATLSVGVILARSTTMATGESDVKIVLDGRGIQTDVSPQIINGRTMIPLRAISESMGAKVGWIKETHTATVNKDGVSIELNTKTNMATVNGKPFVLDQPAAIVNGRTLVPIRFVSESLGSEVNWDEKTRTVKVKSFEEVQKENEEIQEKDDYDFVDEFVDKNIGSVGEAIKMTNTSVKITSVEYSDMVYSEGGAFAAGGDSIFLIINYDIKTDIEPSVFYHTPIDFFKSVVVEGKLIHDISALGGEEIYSGRNKSGFVWATIPKGKSVEEVWISEPSIRKSYRIEI